MDSLAATGISAGHSSSIAFFFTCCNTAGVNTTLQLEIARSRRRSMASVIPFFLALVFGGPNFGPLLERRLPGSYLVRIHV
ncbi:hypothetical protein R3P38DRAFT_1404462 [Favolaschia claudopus]|uniref:Uncharacterized protein n=1 Tax=Favolaschia claudopus TaxID=2862362 RepID=A0AAW0ASF4_9AGAR